MPPFLWYYYRMSALVLELSRKLRLKGWKLVTAESCTGGMIAAAITDLAGSSAVFDRGFITYSNEAKRDHLNVSRLTLDQFGAVSREVAEEMAKGALANSNAHVAISVTGVAGPAGGSDEKPVGLVYIGAQIKGSAPHVTKNLFDGDRASIRAQAVETALKQLSHMIGE